MSDVTLEIVSHGPEQEQVLSISAHVNKYIEQFLYLKKISETSVPIVYYESEELDSWKNLQIISRSHVIPDNDFQLNANENTWVTFTGESWTSKYKEMAFTDYAIRDSLGKIRPLFYKHDLNCCPIFFIKKFNTTVMIVYYFINN